MQPDYISKIVDPTPCWINADEISSTGNGVIEEPEEYDSSLNEGLPCKRTIAQKSPSILGDPFSIRTISPFCHQAISGASNTLREKEIAGEIENCRSPDMVMNLATPKSESGDFEWCECMSCDIYSCGSRSLAKRDIKNASPFCKNLLR
jgi:hypothetical protein